MGCKEPIFGAGPGAQANLRLVQKVAERPRHLRVPGRDDVRSARCRDHKPNDGAAQETRESFDQHILMGDRLSGIQQVDEGGL